MRDSTIFYRSFYEAIKELPAENQARIYSAIFEYSLNGVEMELSGLDRTVFTLVKPQLEANLKRYENGNKPKQKQNRSETEAKPKQDESKVEANKNDNVNDNQNVNVNENQNENKNKKVNKISSSSTDEVNTNDYLKVYNEFLEKKIGASEHFSIAGRAALKKIRQYLEAQVKIKHPHMEDEELESQTLAAFNYLFVNFDKWDNFHKGQIKLQQIESNLLNIINSIKNGNPKDKRPADPFKMATEAIALSRAAAKERASRDSQMPQD